MAGIFGDDEQQPTGLLGMLQNPMSQAYLAMILKGLSPHSEIDPQAMVAQAQRLQLAQQERRRADQARRDAMEQRERFHQDTLYQQDRDFGLREQQASAINAERGLTETSRHLIQQGLKPGTPEYIEAYKDLMRDKSPKFTPHTIESGGGEKTTVFQGPGNKFYKPEEVIPGYIAPDPKLKPLPGESAGRVALIDEYLKRAPAIGAAIDKGDLTGPLDVTAAKAGYGEQGKLYADIESGVDALRRSLTGAGMPASEAEQYTRRYQPSYLDSTKSLRDKHERLNAELTRMRENILQGRGGQRAEPSMGSQGDQKKSSPMQGAKQAPDGKFYVPDPNRPGKYLRVDP